MPTSSRSVAPTPSASVSPTMSRSRSNSPRPASSSSTSLGSALSALMSPSLASSTPSPVSAIARSVSTDLFRPGLSSPTGLESRPVSPGPAFSRPPSPVLDPTSPASPGSQELDESQSASPESDMTDSPSSGASLNPGPLLDCLKRTKGPVCPETDPECPICYNPIGENDATIEHIDCGRRFDTECLHTWITSTTFSSCPICRRRIPTLDSFEDHIEDQAELYRDTRRQRPTPEVYHVMGDLQQMVELLQSRTPQVSEAGLLAHMKHELARSDDMITMTAVEVGVDVFTTAHVLEHRNEFALDRDSIKTLWRYSRLFGANKWYLAQLDSIPSVGFWVPLGLNFQIDDDRQSNTLASFYGGGPDSRPSTLRQVPLPTEFVMYHLGLRNGCVPGRVDEKFMQMSMLEEAEGISHWFVCDLEQNDRPTELHILPWPSESVGDGFQSLAYPGYNSYGISRASEWDHELELPSLLEFLEEQRQNFLATNEEGDSSTSSSTSVFDDEELDTDVLIGGKQTYDEAYDGEDEAHETDEDSELASDNEQSDSEESEDPSHGFHAVKAVPDLDSTHNVVSDPGPDGETDAEWYTATKVDTFEDTDAGWCTISEAETDTAGDIGEAIPGFISAPSDTLWAEIPPFRQLLLDIEATHQAVSEQLASPMTCHIIRSASHINDADSKIDQEDSKDQATIVQDVRSEEAEQWPDTSDPRDLGYDIYGIGHHGNRCRFAQDFFAPMDMREPESSFQRELESDFDGMELCDDY